MRESAFPPFSEPRAAASEEPAAGRLCWQLLERDGGLWGCKLAAGHAGPHDVSTETRFRHRAGLQAPIVKKKRADCASRACMKRPSVSLSRARHVQFGHGSAISTRFVALDRDQREGMPNPPDNDHVQLRKRGMHALGECRRPYAPLELSLQLSNSALHPVLDLASESSTADCFSQFEPMVEPSASIFAFLEGALSSSNHAHCTMLICSSQVTASYLCDMKLSG